MTRIIHHPPVPPESLLAEAGSHAAATDELTIRVISPGSTDLLAVLDMDQLHADLQAKLAQEACSREEQRQFAAFGLEKRRREWLAGRLAAKAAIRRMAADRQRPFPMRQLSIMADSHGRPILRTSMDLSPKLYLSISHSVRYAAALVSHQGPCGLDIQRIVPKIKKISSRFTDRHEQEILASLSVKGGATVWLTMLWAAKEALKKQAELPQPPFLEGIRLHHVAPSRILGMAGWIFSFSLPRSHQPRALHQVGVLRFSEYILAFTLENPNA